MPEILLWFGLFENEIKDIIIFICVLNSQIDFFLIFSLQITNKLVILAFAKLIQIKNDCSFQWHSLKALKCVWFHLLHRVRFSVLFVMKCIFLEQQRKGKNVEKFNYKHNARDNFQTAWFFMKKCNHIECYANKVSSPINETYGAKKKKRTQRIKWHKAYKKANK